MQMDDDRYSVFSLTCDINNDRGFIVSNENPPLSVRDDMKYTEFKALLQRVDDILGGSLDYAAESLIGFGKVPATYEEAVQRYSLFIDQDKITGGYSRLFSDYEVAAAALGSS